MTEWLLVLVLLATEKEPEVRLVVQRVASHEGCMTAKRHVEGSRVLKLQNARYECMSRSKP